MAGRDWGEELGNRSQGLSDVDKGMLPGVAKGLSGGCQGVDTWQVLRT